MVNKKTTPVEVELNQLSKLKTHNDSCTAANDPIAPRDDNTSLATTMTATTTTTARASPSPEPDNKKKSFIDKVPFKKSWLLWWNSEEWWSCWIGLIFFGCIASAVKHNIPSPQFLPWETNPFSTFAANGNYGLIVICFCMGALLWLAMAATKAPNWRKFPAGYAVVFFIALISKMLASNGKKAHKHPIILCILTHIFFSF